MNLNVIQMEGQKMSWMALSHMVLWTGRYVGVSFKVLFKGEKYLLFKKKRNRVIRNSWT